MSKSCNVSGMKTSENYIDGKVCHPTNVRNMLFKQSIGSTITPGSQNSLTFTSDLVVEHHLDYTMAVYFILVPCVKTQHLCSAILSCQRSAHSMN